MNMDVLYNTFIALFAIDTRYPCGEAKTIIWEIVHIFSKIYPQDLRLFPNSGMGVSGQYPDK